MYFILSFIPCALHAYRLGVYKFSVLLVIIELLVDQVLNFVLNMIFIPGVVLGGCIAKCAE